MKKILFVNQEKSQCGVYQFGKNTATIISSFNHIHQFDYVETQSPYVFDAKYDLIIFNHHPCTMAWVTEDYLSNKKSKVALLMHDNRFVNKNVDAVLHPDPTFINDGIDYSVGRPILEDSLPILVDYATIGSFGFGFDHKGFDDLIKRVNSEFDNATVRIHIPLNSKVDENGTYAYRMRKILEKLPKPGINLEISHDYKSEQELINWLKRNHINVFMYKNTEGLSSGCSSTVDWALAAKRPIAVSDDKMFRHITTYAPEVCLKNNSIQKIMDMGLAPLDYFYSNWTNTKLYENYCGVVDEILRS